jgi:hypothetical protein
VIDLVSWLSWLSFGALALWIHPELRPALPFMWAELRRGAWREADMKLRLLMILLGLLFALIILGGLLSAGASLLMWLLDAAGRLGVRSASGNRGAKH